MPAAPLALVLTLGVVLALGIAWVAFIRWERPLVGVLYGAAALLFLILALLLVPSIGA